MINIHLDENGEFDELFVEGESVHLERMADDELALCIGKGPVLVLRIASGFHGGGLIGVTVMEDNREAVVQNL